VESECHYCGTTDKHRCRTQENADVCLSYAQKDMRRIDLTKKTPETLKDLPELALTQRLQKTVIRVRTHVDGIPGRTCVEVTSSNPTGDIAAFVIETNELPKIIELLQQVHEYTKKGILK